MNINKELKLYCYSIEGFKNAMKSLGYGRNDENRLLDDNIAIISICCIDTNPEEYKGLFSEEHYFNNKSNAPNILNIEFDDLDPAMWLGIDFDPDNAKEEDFYYGKNLALDWKLSCKIVRFIINNIGKDFYIHCSAGVSRSQAIVRYILDIYPEYNYKTRQENPCIHPNMHVLRMLKRTYCKNMLGHI